MSDSTLPQKADEPHIPPPPSVEQTHDELRACIIGMAAISIMLHDLQGCVDHIVARSQLKDRAIEFPWNKFNSSRWTAMQEARRGIAAIMENLGDTLNGCDCVDDMQIDATTFAFTTMHRLADADAAGETK